MDADPKTTPATTTVGELRRWFEGDAHLRTALLTDGPRFLGSVEPADLPPDAAPDQLGAQFAHRPAHVIGPERPAADALARLDAADECRVVVLADDDRTLVGLVCMDAARSHFCVPRQAAAPDGAAVAD